MDRERMVIRRRLDVTAHTSRYRRVMVLLMAASTIQIRHREGWSLGVAFGALPIDVVSVVETDLPPRDVLAHGEPKSTL